MEQKLDSKHKALKINLDNNIYGSFAEIGAGQEVARTFFQAGGAAGTMAKSMSAYDMIMSDTIYGKEKSGRYVCEDRVVRMLGHEFDILKDRLGPHRGKETKFFAFADTVAAKSYKGTGRCHGWFGVRFQHEPGAEYSEVIVHIRMHDNQNILQQKAVGILGTNLIYACFFHSNSHEEFVDTLMDDLTIERVSIDMIRARGDAFKGIDSRLLSLELVKKEYTQAILFDNNGEATEPSDVLYKKNLMVLRGSFRPPTHVNMDMLKTGLECFKSDLANDETENIIVLPEISMNKLVERGSVDNNDFLARIDLLNELNHKCLVTGMTGYSTLLSYLSGMSKKKLAVVLGIYNLMEVFDVSDPNKNILKVIGDVANNNTTMYVYPAQDEKTKKIIDSKAALNENENKELLEFLLDRSWLKDMKSFDPTFFTIWSRKVLKLIETGDKSWESMVPEVVKKAVIKNKLFDYKD